MAASNEDVEMTQERIDDLEMRIAFQESTLQTMSDEMATQQQHIEKLMEEVALLQKALQSASASPLLNQADEPPPPHY